MYYKYKYVIAYELPLTDYLDINYFNFQFLVIYENVKLLQFNANVHVFRRITRRLYDYCIREKLVDGMLAAKWKKSGSCYVKIDLVGYVVSCSSRWYLQTCDR